MRAASLAFAAVVATMLLTLYIQAAAGRGETHRSWEAGRGGPATALSAAVRAQGGAPATLCVNCVVKTLKVADAPTGLAFDPTNGKIYVGSYGSKRVTVIDGATNAVTGSITVALSPRDLTFVPATSLLYADIIRPSNGLGSTMAVVDPSNGTIVKTIRFSGSVPISPCFDPANGNLYVPMHYSGFAAVVNASTFKQVATVSVGAYAGSAVCDSANGEIYVANQNSDSVTAIYGSNNTVAATISTGSGSGPYGTAIDTATGDVYIGDEGTSSNNYQGSEVTIINGSTNQVVGNVSVGLQPDFLAYDSGSRDVYVSNHAADNVSVIDGATRTVVATIPVGHGPLGMAYDPANRDLYVANEVDDTVSVIATAAPTWSAVFTPQNGGFQSGSTFLQSNSSSTGCGSAVNVSHGPSFNRSGGFARAAVTASIVACGGTSGSAAYEARIGVAGLNLTVPANRSYNFSFGFNYRGPIINLSALAPPNASGTLHAAFDLSLHEKVLDRSTGGLVVETASRGIDHWLVTPLTRHTPNATASGVFGQLNVPLRAGDTYQIVAWMTFDLRVWAAASCPAKSSALASIWMEQSNGLQGTASVIESAEVYYF